MSDIFTKISETIKKFSEMKKNQETILECYSIGEEKYILLDDTDRIAFKIYYAFEKLPEYCVFIDPSKVLLRFGLKWFAIIAKDDGIKVNILIKSFGTNKQASNFF